MSHQDDYKTTERKAEMIRQYALSLFKDERKAKLLAHYATKPVTKFMQFDGFHLDGYDCVIHPDQEGDGVMYGFHEELMTGGQEVRVMVRDDVPREIAHRLLTKITKDMDSQITFLKSDDLLSKV